MAIFKDPRVLAQNLTEKPGRTPFFYDQRKRNLFDSVLDEFDFGDSTYDKSREGALAKLKGLYIDARQAIYQPLIKYGNF